MSQHEEGSLNKEETEEVALPVQWSRGGLAGRVTGGVGDEQLMSLISRRPSLPLCSSDQLESSSASASAEPAQQLFDTFYAPHRNSHFLPIYHQTYLYSIPSVNHPTTRHRITPSIETPLIQSPPNTVISIAQPITPIPSTPSLKRFPRSSQTRLT